MWVIHVLIVLLALLVLLAGYWLPLPDNQGSDGFLRAFVHKLGMLLGGLFGLWYGMTMLGWTLVQVTG